MQKLDVRRLKEDLNELCKFLDKAYDINCGGCCFLSSLIAKHLEILGISYSLIINDEVSKNINAIVNEVKSKKLNKNSHDSISGLHTCNHYYIYITGVGPINKFDTHTYSYRISEINYKNINWIYKKGDWNDCYNKSNNKLIKSLVSTFFTKYEKRN